MNAMKLTQSRFVLLLVAAGIVAMVAGPALAGQRGRGARITASCGQVLTTTVYGGYGYATSGGSRLIVVQPQPWGRGAVIFGRTSGWGRHVGSYRSRRSHSYRSRRRGYYSNRSSRYSSRRRGSGFRFTFGF